MSVEWAVDGTVCGQKVDASWHQDLMCTVASPDVPAGGPFFGRVFSRGAFQGFQGRMARASIPESTLFLPGV